MIGWHPSTDYPFYVSRNRGEREGAFEHMVGSGFLAGAADSKHVWDLKDVEEHG
jgi:hypothetical protein